MSDVTLENDGQQPKQEGRDLSDGLLDYQTKKEQQAQNAIIDEVVVIRRLRIGVAVVIVLVLTVLSAALLVTICSFNKQIDKATPEVKHLVEAAKAVGSPPSAVAVSVDPTGTRKPASAASAPVAAVTPETPAVMTSVKIDIASIAGSIVAVISILVVAIAVIAISLMQATFKLSPHRPEEPKKDDKADDSKDAKKESDNGLPLPAKEGLRMIYECLKPLFGKGEK